MTHSPSPRQALHRLRSGNEQFRSDGGPVGDISRLRRLSIAREQQPFACLVGCSDSRVGPELLFGAGLGDLFIVRNAGNVVGASALGSVEYAVSVLEVPLVVVLGHERCGAVGAALEVAEGGERPSGAIGHLVDSILPAIQPVVGTCSGDDLGSAAVRANVRSVVAQLRGAAGSSIPDRRDTGRLWVVGAYYGLDTGEVEFFDTEQ